MSTYKNIPTNIISGFLGSGKTTAIQYLLKQKPASENWAVIVNEFGQVGIDGALLKNSEVSIQEIPGGCLCCVGSQSLSVGLNKIIRAIKPQRIIIEPTGLGHPAKLIESLTGEFYQSVLDLKAVIALLDARNLNDECYTNNQTFIDQSLLADILVGSKLDTYSAEDKNQFYQFAMMQQPEKLKVVMVEQGRLALDWLDLPRLKNRKVAFPQMHSHNKKSQIPAPKRMQQNWLLIEGHANSFYSVGWKVNSSNVFNREKLLDFISGLFENTDIERAKGVFLTRSGWVSVNFTPYDKEILNCEAHGDSLFEIISAAAVDAAGLDLALKSQLLVL